jgi:hypothetical protein
MISMDFFSRNKLFLESVDAKLAAQLEQFKGQEVLPLEAAKKGGNTLKLGSQYVHSRYAPQAEAEKWTKGERAKIHIHFGFGLGYGVSADDPLPEGLILVYEPFPLLFWSCLHQCDLQTIYGGKKIFVRFDLRDIAQLLMQLPFKDDRIAVRSNLFHGKVAQNQWLNLQQTLKDVVIRRAAARETLRQSTAAFTEAVLSAAPHFLSTPSISSLRYRYKGVPAVVVAAGPSLDKSLAYLKTIEKKVVIIAISRAAKPLERFGIKPDFLLHNESQDYGHLIQDCSNLEHSTLILDSQAHPDVVRFPSRSKFVYHSAVNFAVPWLAKILPNYAPVALETAGSVANEAFSFARYLGCTTIYLMGQDLALTRGAYYAEAEHNQAFSHSSNSIVPIAGYFGVPLQTFVTYKAFAVWFEEQAAGNANETLINATEGGAKLAGFRREKLAHHCALLRNLPDKPANLAHERFEVDRPKVDLKRFRAFLEESSRDLKKLVKYGVKFEQRVAHPKSIADQEIPKLQQSIENLVRKYSVISGFIQSELQDLKKDERSSNDPRVILQEQGRAYKVIVAGAEACLKVLEQLFSKIPMHTK